MRALKLIKQADYQQPLDNKQNNQFSKIYSNPYAIGAGAGVLGTGVVGYGLAKKKIDNINKEKEDLANTIKAKNNIISNYQEHLKALGAPKEVLTGEAPRPGVVKRVFGRIKSVFR